jgi:hypothetical protein
MDRKHLAALARNVLVSARLREGSEIVRKVDRRRSEFFQNHIWRVPSFIFEKIVASLKPQG